MTKDASLLFCGWVSFPPHVFPLNDTRAHIADDCWCEPKHRGRLIIHQSQDRREEYERGRKTS